MPHHDNHSPRRRITQNLLGADRYLALREAMCRYRAVRATLGRRDGTESRAIRDDRLVNSRHRLDRLRNLHRGQRCFIVGNGPSLNRMDLSLLRHETWFGLNRIYLMKEALGFDPSYLVCVNKLVLEQFAAEFVQQSVPLFASVRAAPSTPLPASTLFLNTLGGNTCFGYDATGILWESATVTYVAMQLAFYMGFREVILIGVDHSFTAKGPANSTVVSEGDDPNHFSPAYFGKGCKWQLPDLVSSEAGYRLAKAAFEADGRIIRDATVGGKLDVFDKVAYGSVFT
jgi:hypothetical protein